MHMHAYIHVLATAMQDAWRTGQCDVARVLSALTEFAMEQEDRHTRPDGDQTQTALNFGARGLHTGQRTSRARTVRRPGPPAGQPAPRTYGRARSICYGPGTCMYAAAPASMRACVRACVSAGGAVARRDAHTAEQHVCARASNNAIGQRAIPATVVRAPTGRWLLPPAGHGRCARSARAASPSKLAAAALGSVVCGRTTSSPRPVGRAVHYVVCVQFPPGGPRAAERTLAFAPCIDLSR